mmetsp:Transcript_43/g.80  ORF Transcript_43/g.80 Transcript_43/m.80 type:complete len:263 (-) Transcript_43:197-985(-)
MPKLLLEGPRLPLSLSQLRPSAVHKDPGVGLICGSAGWDLNWADKYLCAIMHGRESQGDCSCSAWGDGGAVENVPVPLARQVKRTAAGDGKHLHGERTDTVHSDWQRAFTGEHGQPLLEDDSLECCAGRRRRRDERLRGRAAVQLARPAKQLLERLELGSGAAVLAERRVVVVAGGEGRVLPRARVRPRGESKVAAAVEHVQVEARPRLKQLLHNLHHPLRPNPRVRLAPVVEPAAPQLRHHLGLRVVLVAWLRSGGVAAMG